MKNIIIRGSRNVGKTTLIKKILLYNNINKYYGFYTKKVNPDENGTCNVYINDFEEKIKFENEENLVGSCTNMSGKKNTLGFENAGVRILDSLKNRPVIVMDELGFLEANAKKFQKKVFEIMDSSALVIAAIKDKKVDFLDKIINADNNEVYDITLDNRDRLATILSETLSNILNEIKNT